MKIRLLIPAVLVAIGLVGVTTRPAQAATVLTGCQRIMAPGEYVLGNNVTQTAPGACFSIRAANVTLDGNGKTITMNDADAVEVAYYESGEVAHHVIVRNIVSNEGVRTYGNDIHHVTFELMHVKSITVFGSDDMVIQSNTVGEGGISVGNADRDGWYAYRANIAHNTITGGATNVKVLLEVGGGKYHPCPRLDTTIQYNTVTDTRNDPPPEATAAVRVRCATHTTFIHNTVTSTGTALGLYLRDESDYGTYTDNTFTSHEFPVLHIAAGNADKTFPSYNVFQRNTFRSDASHLTYLFGLGTGNQFVQNVFWGSETFGYYGGNFGNRWDHNTFYVGGDRWYLGGNHFSGPPVDTFTNNIFSYSGGSLFTYDGWVKGRYDGDYNLFHNRGGALSFGSLGTLAQWAANGGSDAHSINADPLFTAAGAGDFSLQSSSPARGHASDGTDIGYSAAVIVVPPSEPTNAGPVTKITSPSGKRTVGGKFVVQATAKDGDGVGRLNFFFDGVQFGTDIRAPYRATLDTRPYRNGTHALTIESVDARGAMTRTTMTLTVKNAFLVRISVPWAKSRVSGTVTLQPRLIYGGADIVKADYFLDKTLKYTSTSAPYDVSWNTIGYKNGRHRLSIRLTDAAGKTATHTVYLTVKN